VTQALAAQWKALDAAGREKYNELAEASKAALRAERGDDDEESAPRKKRGSKKNAGPKKPPAPQTLWAEQKGKPELKASGSALTGQEMKSKLAEQWKAMTVRHTTTDTHWKRLAPLRPFCVLDPSATSRLISFLFFCVCVPLPLCSGGGAAALEGADSRGQEEVQTRARRCDKAMGHGECDVTQRCLERGCLPISIPLALTRSVCVCFWFSVLPLIQSGRRTTRPARRMRRTARTRRAVRQRRRRSQRRIRSQRRTRRRRFVQHLPFPLSFLSFSKGRDRSGGAARRGARNRLGAHSGFIRD